MAVFDQCQTARQADRQTTYSVGDNRPHLHIQAMRSNAVWVVGSDRSKESPITVEVGKVGSF